MGQRNENTLREKMEEAKERKQSLESQLQSGSEDPFDEEVKSQIQRIDNFLEFARWQLGKDKELEF